MKKKYCDISWPITEKMTAYKDNYVVQIKAIKNFDEHAVRDSLVTIGTHSGTHIDAPAHFMKDGSTIDQLDLSAVIGTARVLDCTSCEQVIMAQDLKRHGIQEGERILLKTKNSYRSATQEFDYDFVYVSQEAAEYLALCKIQSVAIDYLGIERKQPDHETHFILFNANIVIIEGVRLSNVEPGSYELVCLPLLCEGLEAAPARAILIG